MDDATRDTSMNAVVAHIAGPFGAGFVKASRDGAFVQAWRRN